MAQSIAKLAIKLILLGKNRRPFLLAVAQNLHCKYKSDDGAISDVSAN